MNSNNGVSNSPSSRFVNSPSRESSVGPAGSDTSESSVDSINQQKPRKLFRIRSRAGEMTFGKLLTGSLFVNPEQAGYVGFANLPNQVHRKSVKKGFEFTLMVVGESGLGKSTLVNSLFLTDLYPERHIPSAAEKIQQTVKIDASTVEIEERGVKLRLTVVDTPGFGDSLNSIDCFKSIIQYIDDQFERYLNDENGLNRRHIVDNRVHCCFYFINPSGHGLKPLDIAFMRAVHHKVNIVPVLAKADTLTQLEVTTLKRKIMDQVDDHGIRIYPLPDCDSDEDEDYKEQCKQLRNAVPFAVVGANTIIEVKSKKVRGRMYPWGVVEVENPEHCDFIKLRTMLITHMQDLQEVTQETHYENFRAEKLATGGSYKSKSGKPAADTYGRMENGGGGEFTDKERELRQKEEELRRMQERLTRMQAEIDSSKRPHLIQNGDLKSQDV
uniref:Septin-type G domain-containing protein n=2 Tax=Arion vulgaris TaxID=1028688 RepID=A0A0B7ATZ0_9EUPU